MMKTIRLRKMLAGIRSLVWPEGCVICGDFSDSFLCSRCFEMGKLDEASRRIESESGLPILSFGRADGPWRKIVHGIKYSNQHRWPRQLLQMLALEDLSIDIGSSPCWVPVPLHHSRRRERGYNQAELIAEAAASIWGGRVERKFLRRAQKSVSQTKLSAEERKSNVLSQFVAKSLSPKGQKKVEQIILVDDVVTTGATLESCRSALVSKGFKVRAALTILRADLSQDDFEGELWESGG